jgi:hypothetical protein
MAKRKQFKARAGYPITDKDAQIIGTALDQAFPNQQVTAEAVVDLAQKKNSPLHRYFDWNDQSAAHKYRLSQAAKIIKAIVVEIEGQEVPAYHHVFIQEMDESQWVTIEKARDTENLWKQVVAQALKEAESWAERYQIYKELTPIVEVINRTRKELEHANASN